MSREELHDDIAETLNDYTSDTTTFESCGFAVESDSKCTLGRRLAQEVLEEHDAVMIKALDTDDGHRMWFDTLKEEEVEPSTDGSIDSPSTEGEEVTETYHTV